MLAIEHNDACESAVEAASSLAATFKRTLIVVHARTPAEASAFLNPCATTLAEFGIKESVEFPALCIVKDGPAEDAILRAVLHSSPCILVTGVKRKSDSPGPHGTVFALLASSRAPVLCIPATAKSAKTSQEGLLAVEVG
jgi:hypothetical protein